MLSIVKPGKMRKEKVGQTEGDQGKKERSCRKSWFKKGELQYDKIRQERVAG